MDDFNDAFGKLDTQMKANADAVATKAEAESVTVIAQTIASSKLCRVKFGSYTGTGTGGSAHPSTPSCGFYPVLMIVTTMDQNNINRAIAIRGITQFDSDIGSRHNTITWNDRDVSWRASMENDSYYNACDVQLNTSGVTYQYLLFGFDQ